MANMFSGKMLPGGNLLMPGLNPVKSFTNTVKDPLGAITQTATAPITATKQLVDDPTSVVKNPVQTLVAT